MRSLHLSLSHPQPQPVEPQPNVFWCLFLEIKVVKGHIRSIYIKGVFIDSNKMDKHHKQYSKYGKKYLVVELPKQLPFRNYSRCTKKKSSEMVIKYFRNGKT